MRANFQRSPPESLLGLQTCPSRMLRTAKITTNYQPALAGIALARTGIRMSTRLLVCLAASAALSSCTTAPEAPMMPEAVVALAGQYENVTAPLNASSARAVLDRTAPLRAALEAISGLRFIRDV